VMLVAATVVVAATVTGCGEASSNSRNSLAAISTCLHKEGLAPTSTSPGDVPPGMTSKQLVAALKKCGVRGGAFSGAEESGPTSPAKRIVVERELVKQVTCLQEHGFHVTATKNVEQQLFNANGVDTKSVRFRAANRKCRQKFVEAIRKLGPGYGPDEGAGSSSVASTGPSVSSQRGTRYAECVHKYGATTIGTGALSGLRIPSDMSSTELRVMLKKCGSGAAKIGASKR
jgi:hypothetical protein